MNATDILNIISSASQGVLDNNKTTDRTNRTGGDHRDNTDPRTKTIGSNHPTQTAAGQSILDILNGMGMNTGGIEQLLMLLSNIGGLDAKDYQDQLYQLLLKQYLTAEQRNYDKSALDEQRIYDSPLNQLSRLMSAGIGRNAAIGMLSPTGEAGLIGSGANAQLPTQVASPSEKAMNIANTAINFVGAVGSLVGLGFSIPQSIMQTQMLKNANWLTESQINAYKSTGQAFSILQKAGAATTAFSSAANAASALNELAKSGNQDAATFIAQGGVDSMLANASFSSQTLGNLALSETSYKDYRNQFDLARKHDRLVNQLTQMDIDKTAADTRLALQQALESDARIQEIYQNIQRGDIEIEIAGERLRMIEADADIASANRNILIGGLEEIDDTTGLSGYQLASHDMFVQFLTSCEESAAKIEDRDAWHEYLKNNVQLARDLALVNAICAETYKMNITDEDAGQPTFMNQLLRIRGLLRDSGLGDDIKLVGSAATDFVKSYINRKVD